MAAEARLQQILHDGVTAVQLVARLSWRRTLNAWIYVPVGLLIVLLACFGVDSLIGLSSVSFPASVACMIMLFGALMICQLIFGDKRTRAILGIVEIPCGFALKYINIFFTPSFVLLPLSPAISGVEIGKIITVFLIGFLVVFTFTAYLVRGLQVLLGTSKRAVTERAEEMGNENDEIPLTETPEGLQNDARSPSTGSATTLAEQLSADPPDDLIAPPRIQDPFLVRGTVGPPAHHEVSDSVSPARAIQDPPPLTRAQRWAALLSANLDVSTYLTLFVFIGLPIYYSIGYSMPAQLSLNILAYFAALSIPPKYKQFLHPVLVSSGITILGIWVLALFHRDTLHNALLEYSTKTRYLQLWYHEKGLQRPGAGDVFSSVLDVSIVALSLPMFQYRTELKRHLSTILLPLPPLLALSILGYPLLCSRAPLSLAPSHALAFSSRSLTLALATPTVANLGGDTTLLAVLCIMSGILGVLIGPAMLTLLRIPEDDYVTRGITLGANSSAIATALLLTTDPRAAAMSSLVMSLFGTVMVVLSSIPPVVTGLRGLVGL